MNLLDGFSSRQAFSEAFFGSSMASKLFAGGGGGSGSEFKSLLEAMLNFSSTVEAGLDEDLFLWGGTETPGTFCFCV
jgi:hypothetical protein